MSIFSFCAGLTLEVPSFRRFSSCVRTLKLDNQQSGRADQAHCCAGMFVVVLLVRGLVARVAGQGRHTALHHNDTRHAASH